MREIEYSQGTIIDRGIVTTVHKLVRLGRNGGVTHVLEWWEGANGSCHLDFAVLDSLRDKTTSLLLVDFVTRVGPNRRVSGPFKASINNFYVRRLVTNVLGKQEKVWRQDIHSGIYMLSLLENSGIQVGCLEIDARECHDFRMFPPTVFYGQTLDVHL